MIGEQERDLARLRRLLSPVDTRYPYQKHYESIYPIARIGRKPYFVRLILYPTRLPFGFLN